MMKWLFGLGFICWLLVTKVWDNGGLPNTDEYSLNEDYTLFEDGMLLEHPMPIVLSGKKRWTVSLPLHLDYPLKPSEYADVCHKSDDLARRLRHLNIRNGFQQTRGSQGYYHVDPSFMDLREAEEHGLLPAGTGDITLVRQEGSNTIEPTVKRSKIEHEGSKGKVCERSLTYVLETTDAGIGKTLMGLWVAYGLAKKEDRAFFIDDTHW